MTPREGAQLPPIVIPIPGGVDDKDDDKDDDKNIDDGKDNCCWPKTIIVYQKAPQDHDDDKKEKKEDPPKSTPPAPPRPAPAPPLPQEPHRPEMKTEAKKCDHTRNKDGESHSDDGPRRPGQPQPGSKPGDETDDDGCDPEDDHRKYCSLSDMVVWVEA